MEILLVFGARSQTLRCANMLRASGYPASVTQSPLRISGGCTLAVGTNREGFAFFSRSAAPYCTFKGAYAVQGGKYVRIF